jgi:ribosomal protein S21
VALEVRRKEKESVQSLIYRFTKAIRESGILLRARERRFRQRPLNKRARKEKALRRLELQKHYEKLKKLGLLED